MGVDGAPEAAGGEGGEVWASAYKFVSRASGRSAARCATTVWRPKNYLTEEELKVLNRIVNFYIEFAELRALDRKPMTMRDWITKLDELLKLSGAELLHHAGSISAEMAKAKAEAEYARYHELQDAHPRPIDADFEKAAKQLQKPRPQRARKGNRQ